MVKEDKSIAKVHMGFFAGSKDLIPVSFRARAGFRGTVKYAPLACHVHREQCRKDDIESWMYMLVEITCGRLPWRNLTSPPVAFNRADATHTPRMRGKFFDAPDYPAIYKLLESALHSTRAQEFPYDWEM
ncbi:hypothetical protein NECAME_06732 [Necator americanus]|uniref:Protein kinase domain-containing protein n=1 Tax=Necator americanus TaxID=51031 RepID=W2TUH1_NECAM|nr:hypothetical protein NECAME_06732 [Necator americanus]ETN84702.1 hypothetical protein NECAME_06732 [Necator americanus]